MPVLIVIDKTSKETIFIKKNADMLTNRVEDYYPLYDPLKMDFGVTEGNSIPHHFYIESKLVKEKNLEMLMESGHLKLQRHEDIIDGKIVRKTHKQLVDEGIITNHPNMKYNENGELVEKTVAELIDDGHLSVDRPFEEFDGIKIKTLTIEELANKQPSISSKHAKICKDKLINRIDKEINSIYPLHRQTQIFTNYTNWMMENITNNNYTPQVPTFDSYYQNILKPYDSSNPWIIKILKSPKVQSLLNNVYAFGPVNQSAIDYINMAIFIESILLKHEVLIKKLDEIIGNEFRTT